MPIPSLEAELGYSYYPFAKDGEVTAMITGVTSRGWQVLGTTTTFEVVPNLYRRGGTHVANFATPRMSFLGSQVLGRKRKSGLAT